MTPELLPTVSTQGVVTFEGPQVLANSSAQLRRGVLTARGTGLTPGKVPLRLTAPHNSLDVTLQGRVVACVAGLVVMTFPTLPADVLQQLDVADAQPMSWDSIVPPTPTSEPAPAGESAPASSPLSTSVQAAAGGTSESASAAPSLETLLNARTEAPAPAEEEATAPEPTPADAAFPKTASVAVAVTRIAVPTEPKESESDIHESHPGNRLQFESPYHKEIPADVLRSVVGDAPPVVIKPAAPVPQDLPLLVHGVAVLYPSLALLRAAEGLATRGAILTRAKVAPQMLEHVTFSLGVLGSQVRVPFVGQVVMVRNGNAAVAFVDVNAASQVFQDAARQVEAEGELPTVDAMEYLASAPEEKPLGEPPSKLVDVPGAAEEGATS
ncbi:MAG: hypothetical protein AB2A00_10315 [Myxococcota bacterium]